MSKYGISLEELVNDREDCISFLSSCLNNNHLSLFLGAGSSKDIGLPDWSELVMNCLKTVSPASARKITKSGVPLSNEELKELTQQIKDKCRRDRKDYLEIVRKNLYKGIELDFPQANKELLIAIASLTIGRERGRVTNIASYNFDSILEWYLATNGLRVKVFSKENYLDSKYDINVIHTHGYLPYNDEHGNKSEKIIFTSEEFTAKWNKQDYFTEEMQSFFKKHIFLAIGLSPKSIIDDIAPYLDKLNDWYEGEKFQRGKPYGIAFLTSFTKVQSEKMQEFGIVPHKLKDFKEIPKVIFQVAQKASIGRILVGK